MIRWLSLAIAVIVVATAACESPEARLERVRDDAAACADGDTCVVAGSGDCVCGSPINENSVEEVEAAADAIACCDLLGSCVAVDCAAFENVACVDGRCVGDAL
jgi:hypothetical protein